MNDVAIRKAETHDISAIKRLLSDSKLPFEDIDAHINDFLVAEKPDGIVGVVGIEIYGRYGLLRSLAVNVVSVVGLSLLGFVIEPFSRPTSGPVTQSELRDLGGE